MKLKVIVLSLILLGISFSAKAATLSVSPSSGTYNIGDTFRIDILLNTQSQAIDAVNVSSLNYEPALLEVQDQGATAGIQILPGTLMSNTVYNSVNTQAGKINFSQIAPGTQTYNGQGILASVTFRVLQAGSANLTFDFVNGGTTGSDVLADANNILTAVTNGSYTLGRSSSSTASLPAPAPAVITTPTPSPAVTSTAVQTPSSVSAWNSVLVNGDLIKGSGPRVYLFLYGRRRFIPTYQLFVARGYDFSLVRIISDDLLNSIPLGLRIANSATYPDGSLIKQLGTDQTYLVTGGKITPLTFEDFIARNYSFRRVITVGPWEFARYSINR